MQWRDLVALLNIAISLTVLSSDIPAGSPLLLRSLQYPKAEQLLLVRDLDKVHELERRGSKQKAGTSSQGSPLTSDGKKKKSPSPATSQTTSPTASSIGTGSVGSSPRNHRWEQGGPSTYASPTSQEKGGKEAGRSPRTPDVLAQTRSSLSQLRVSQAGPSTESPMHTVQSNIGRSRSQSPDGGARSPVQEPGSPEKPDLSHGDPDFGNWIRHSQTELAEAKRRAADTGTNTRRGQRVALSESKKAETARLNAKTAHTRARASRVAATAAIANNPKPKMIDPAHKVVFESGITHVDS